MIYLRLCVFAILFMCLGSKSAVACQEGMGGLNANSPREVQAEGIIITWSEANDELRGFSQKLGDWEVLKIDPQKLNPQQKITPVVDSSIAAVRIGDSIAAFSGEKGWWDVVELSTNSTAVPVVSPSLAVFEDNGHLYTFSANKGSWSSPTDPNLVPVQQEVKLAQHGGGKGRQKLNEWMQQLPAYMERGISVQTMTGRIIVTVSRRNWLPEVLQKVNELLVTEPESMTGTSQGASADARTQDDDVRIAELRAELSTLDLAVLAASGQFSNPNVDQDQQSRELRRLVEQSFDLRQQLQELEAQRLRLKLQQVENNLAVRAKSRELIISRQMENLQGRTVETEWNKAWNKAAATAAPQRNREDSLGDLPSGNPSAAAIASGMRPIAGDRIRWPQPTEIIRTLKKSREIYIERGEAIKLAQLQIEIWSRPLDQLRSEGRVTLDSEDSRASRDIQLRLEEAKKYANSLMQPPLESFTKDWRQAWSEYQSLLTLLKLDVEEAQNLVDSHSKELIRLNGLFEEGVIPVEAVQKCESAIDAATINLQRAEQILKLYADIETNEPELNPATLKGLTEVATDKDAAARLPNEPSQNLPQQVITMAEQLRKFRDAAVELREERQPLENLIIQYSRRLEQLKAEGVVNAETTEEDLKTQMARSKPEFVRLTREFDAATKAWRQAWSAYQSQSRLLELEVKHAENSLVSAEQTLAETHAKSDQGLVGWQEVRDTEARRSAAVVQHRKAHELLHLWKELESNEPELNPDWKPESSGKNVPE